MKMFQLNYNQWRTGQVDTVSPENRLGDGGVSLRNPQFKQHNCCCLGLMLLECDVPPHALFCASPAALRSQSDLQLGFDATALLNKLTLLNKFGHLENSHLARVAVNINDYLDEPIPMKMARLTRLFREEGTIELQWTNVPENVRGDYERYLADTDTNPTHEEHAYA